MTFPQNTQMRRQWCEHFYQGLRMVSQQQSTAFMVFFFLLRKSKGDIIKNETGNDQPSLSTHTHVCTHARMHTRTCQGHDKCITKSWWAAAVRGSNTLEQWRWPGFSVVGEEEAEPGNPQPPACLSFPTMENSSDFMFCIISTP